jgi:hypothetical protein
MALFDKSMGLFHARGITLGGIFFPIPVRSFMANLIYVAVEPNLSQEREILSGTTESKLGAVQNLRQ